MAGYSRWKLAGILLGLWAIWAGALVAKGGLYIAKHEGDAMHLAEIVLRQAAGGWPHLDFMTPIGVLATGPIAAFVAAGWDLGAAVLAAQAAVSLALLPACWWIGASRLGLGWGSLFGAIVIGLIGAVVHGEAERALSISMHYNRWAWALAFLAIAIAVVPPRLRSSSPADGVILGLSFAALALIKVTYVVAFLPPVLLALALRHDRSALFWALGAGVTVVLVVTVAAGPAFWPAYLGDLLATARSTIRSAPGDSFTGVIAAPAYLGGSLVAVLGVILLRQSGRDQEGLLLLTLLPGFFYVTYQNYGNDPQWLYLLGILLLALRPAPGTINGAGWDLRQALALAGCAAFMLGLPSAMNLASSPFRHFATDETTYAPLLPGNAQAASLQFTAIRSQVVTGRAPLPDFPLPEVEPAVLNGEPLDHCQLDAGTVTLFAHMAETLETSGHAGKAVATADLFNALWLFGPFDPLPGGAPWHYGGLPGAEAADLLVVPLCPVLPKVRRQILEDIGSRNWTLTELARTPHYRVMEIQRP